MIISASRIATSSGSGAVGAHVFGGPKNESITVVQGSRPELDDMVRDARDHGAKYAIRHYKISPEQATTREEAFAVAAALGREFGFDPSRGVLVEHEKRRHGGKGFDRHWHFMVPEVDPVRGRVLDASWMRARHEKVSRVAEIELGHDQVRGKWSRAVEAALRAEGRDELADRVQPLTVGDRPAEAFSAVRHQMAERRGASMPEMKAAVAAAWQRSDNGAALRASLAEQGLTARPGDKKGVWLVEATGADGAPVLVGSLARLTRAKAEEVGARMAQPIPAAVPRVPETQPAPTTTQAARLEPAAPQAASAAPWQAAPVRLPTKKGSPEDDIIKLGIEFGREVTDAFDDAFRRAADTRQERADAAAAALVDRGLARDRGDGGPGLPGAAEGDGRPRIGPGPIRRPSGSDGGGQLAAPPEPPGAAAGTGNVPTRPGRGPSRSDRREPSQAGAQAGRNRVQARRAAAGLAAEVDARGGRLDELTRRLAFPPTVATIQADRARAELAASRARIAAVLATEPWPNPADRKAGPLQDKRCDQVKATMDARAVAAAAALMLAEQLRGRVGLVARALFVIGLETPAFRRAAEAAREAQQAEGDAKNSRIDYRENLAAADRSGVAEAAQRQRDQDEWEDRPDVVAARREEAGNRQVVAAAKAGDPEIREALRQEDGLRLAREVLFRREAERLAEIQRQQRHDRRTAAAAPLVRQPAPSMAPR